MATKTLRTVRKVEKPRPLKIAETTVKLHSVPNEIISPVNESHPLTDNILDNLKSLHVSISNGNLNDGTLTLIRHVCCQLKASGSYLEIAAKEQLEKYFVTLRNASRDERVATHIRTQLLEIIELRAMGWKSNENITSYYEQKIVNVEQQSPSFMLSAVGIPNALMSSVSTSAIPTSIFQPPPLMTSASQVSLGPGEILKNSGKFIKPTRIPGKNFFKDEVLIRNSDSGKVMGIKGRRVHMIEELSDTIISFQRVSPGARDRLVQITGPHEDNISRAKGLMEETIRRNASPVRDPVELGSLGGLVTSGSCTSLNSSASEESLQNQQVTQQYQPPMNVSNQLHQQQVPVQQVSVQPQQALLLSYQPPVLMQQQPQVQHQQPFKKAPLMHSLSMASTLAEYSHTIPVGSNSIRISGSQAEIVRTAKLVLEEYFAGQAELSNLNLSTEVPTNTHKVRSHSRILRQSTQDSDNGNGSLSNGHVGNSSSEEDTFKAEGSPPDAVSELPLDSPHQQSTGFVLTWPNIQPPLARKTSSKQVETNNNLNKGSVPVVRQPLFPSSKQEDVKQVENSGDATITAARNRRALFSQSSSQRNSSSSQERSFEKQGSIERQPWQRENFCHISNSYEFLLECSSSPYAKVMPEGLKTVVPDVAAIIVKETPTDYFDWTTYFNLASIKRTLSGQKPSPGPEETWEVN